MTIPVVKETFHTMRSVRVQQMVIPYTYCLRKKWKANRYSNSTISFKSSRFKYLTERDDMTIPVVK
jgi:hypothetical protein